MHARWVDWEFEVEDGENELGWLRDGWTKEDGDMGESSVYLEEMDYPPVPA